MKADGLRDSDPAVVARYLQLRSLLHDRHLARAEQLVLDRYLVQPTRRLPPTLLVHVRMGFYRPGEGELWPVVFLNAVDISLGLCVELSAERVASLGTVINGPQRIRQRHWEEWWGWERPLGQLGEDFFQLSVARQEEVVLAWYSSNLEWLVHNGLLRRRG